MKIGYVSIIIFFIKTMSSDTMKKHIIPIITNYNENCNDNYSILISYVWNQQILPSFYDEIMLLKSKENIEEFSNKFKNFLVKSFLQDEIDCLSYVYQFFSEKLEFFNDLNLDNFRQDYSMNVNVDSKQNIRDTYDTYYKFFKNNKNAIINKKTLIIFYVLQHYITNIKDCLLGSKKIDINIKVIFAHDLSEFKTKNKNDYFSAEELTDGSEICDIGILIDPAYTYFNKSNDLMEYLHNLLQEIFDFLIRGYDDNEDDRKFDFIWINDIKSQIPLPIFTEEFFCDEITTAVYNVINETYALKESIYHYFNLIEILEEFVLIINPINYLYKNNINVYKESNMESKNFYDTRANYTVYNYSNHTNCLITKNKLIRVNTALVQYLTQKIINAKIIRLQLLATHQDTFFKVHKNKTEYDIICRICQIFFKEISLYLCKLGLKPCENSFTFYTFFKTIFTELDNHKVLSLEMLENFYAKYIDKIIDVNLNCNPTFISIVTEEHEKDSLIFVAETGKINEDKNLFNRTEYINPNNRYSETQTFEDDKESNNDFEKTENDYNVDHNIILSNCIYYAIHAILYNCSFLQDPIHYHKFLDEFNNYIDRPNLNISSKHIEKSNKDISTMREIGLARNTDPYKILADVADNVNTVHICNFYHLRCKESQQFDNEEKSKIQKDIEAMFVDFCNLNFKLKDNCLKHYIEPRIIILNCTCMGTYEDNITIISDEAIVDYIKNEIDVFIMTNKEKLSNFYFTEHIGLKK